MKLLTGAVSLGAGFSMILALSGCESALGLGSSSYSCPA